MVKATQEHIAVRAAHSVQEDLTGRRSFARNVTFSWGAYAINAVAGFVLPRLISDRLGQETLGVWDFSWSMVSYFGLVHLGLNSSINRYVALHRASGDRDALCRSVSTIALFMNVAGLFAAILTLVGAFGIVPLFASKLGAQMPAARLVVLYLGAQVALSVMLTVYQGVLVGCHRWDLHNVVSSICSVANTVGMIGVLLAGGGLPGLALVHSLVMVGGDLARVRLARRVCPEMRIDFREARWNTWLEKARFSAKSLIPSLADMVSSQSLSFFLTACMGPASLAVYCRPQNLVRQGQTLAAKFGYILTPTASSLQAQADHDALRATFLGSVRGLAALALPGVIALALFGDHVIHVWMGKAYVHPGLLAVLALGSYPAWVQEPAWSTLMGLNRHGMLAWAKLGRALLSMALLAVGLGWLHWHLYGVACAMVLPLAFVEGIVTPVLGCRRMNLPVRDYYREAFLLPALCSLPFALCLMAARWVIADSPWLGAGLMAMGTALLSLVYWKVFIPPSWKAKFTRWFAPVTT